MQSIRAWTQQLPDWIGSHVRALTFIGGSPKVIVPDNLPACSRIAAKIRHDHPDLRRFAPAGGKIDKHYYSVPHSLRRQPISARITATTIELFHRGRRVASHLRSRQQRRHTTTREHMPKVQGVGAHRRYAGWTHERLQTGISILKNNIDRRPPDPDVADGPTIYHQYLRGPTYFQ